MNVITQKLEKLAGDKVLWAIFFFLLAVSAIEVYSATSSLVYGGKFSSYTGPITGHLKFILIGVIIAFTLPFLYNCCRARKLLGIWLFGFLLLLTAVTLISGNSANDARRWISLGGFQFQPSEFLRFAYVWMLGWSIGKSKEAGLDKGKLKDDFYAVVAVAGTIAATLLVGVENNSTGLMIYGVGFLTCLICRFHTRGWLKITGILTLLATALVTLVIVTGINVGRVTTAVNRVSRHFSAPKVEVLEINDKNLQEMTGKIAIANSHLIGVGPCNSKERDSLPQAYSDFIFAIIIEELGLFGALIVMLLYISLLYRCGKIASQTKNRTAGTVAIAIGITMSLQAFIHMCVATGLGPVTGQTLPLISRGGTSMLVNCAYIGILQNLYYFGIEKAEKKKKEEQQSAADNNKE